MIVTGYAVNGERGLPATDLWIEVDGRKTVKTRTWLPSPEVRTAYMDDALSYAGIEAELTHEPTGPHVARLRVVERRAPEGLPAAGDTPFVVTR